MIPFIYQIPQLILMPISCHWSVVLVVQGYILGSDSFLGQATAKAAAQWLKLWLGNVAVGWLNFWLTVFSQAVATLLSVNKGVWEAETKGLDSHS